MASKVSITAPNKAGEAVKVVAQQEGDMVFVWIANGIINTVERIGRSGS